MVHKVYQVSKFQVEIMNSLYLYTQRDLHNTSRVIYCIQIDQEKELHQEEYFKQEHGLDTIYLEILRLILQVDHKLNLFQWNIKLGSTGTLCSPSHDTYVMEPPGYTIYPAGAFCSYAGSGSDCYYYYREGGPLGYLGGNYLN